MDPEQIPVNAARRKLAAGDFHGALNDFNRAMRFDPNDLELLLGRADAYVGLGDIDQAVADLQRVQARDKEQGWKDEAAKLAERIDDLTQRQAQLGKTVDHVPGAPGPTRPWLLKQAGLKSAKHDYAGAITDYTSALDIKPDAPGYRGRADARRALGDFAGAGADYDRALGLEDDSLNKAIIQYERGHLRRLKGDLLGAVADFRPLAQYAHFSLRPDCCDASFWLFLAQCELGHPDQAAAELSHRLAIDKVPWDEADWTIAQFLLGHISEAQLDRTQPQPAYVMWTLKAPFYSAMLRRRAGDNAGALKRFRQALTSPILKMGHEYEIEAAEARRAVAALTARGE
jgi:tetratricopeptide (TPR) repeat protein